MRSARPQETTLRVVEIAGESAVVPGAIGKCLIKVTACEDSVVALQISIDSKRQRVEGEEHLITGVVDDTIRVDDLEITIRRNKVASEARKAERKGRGGWLDQHRWIRLASA